MEATMNYRDDLEAALERIAALERELRLRCPRRHEQEPRLPTNRHLLQAKTDAERARLARTLQIRERELTDAREQVEAYRQICEDARRLYEAVCEDYRTKVHGLDQLQPLKLEAEVARLKEQLKAVSSNEEARERELACLRLEVELLLEGNLERAREYFVRREEVLGDQLQEARDELTSRWLDLKLEQMARAQAPGEPEGQGRRARARTCAEDNVPYQQECEVRRLMRERERVRRVLTRLEQYGQLPPALQ
jgi:hypothetical protein